MRAAISGPRWPTQTPRATTSADITFKLLSLKHRRCAGLDDHACAGPKQSRSRSTSTSCLLRVMRQIRRAVGHVGTMQIISETPLAAVSLRFEGLIFTSVPPFSLASLMLPIESWMRPVESWVQQRPWLAPLASLARILSGLHFRLGIGNRLAISFAAVGETCVSEPYLLLDLLGLTPVY